MTSALRRSLPVGAVALAAVCISRTSDSLGDYPTDAAPAIDAFAAGQIGEGLAAQPLMGLFSILVRAPFAALAGGSELDAYRWGAVPCIFAAGLLGLYLAALARRRGARLPVQALIVAVAMVNPLTFEALALGHPEEILTGALAVGAVAAASRGRLVPAALLLGLALATKQWAVIAILPVLMAAPTNRVRLAVGAAAVAVVLTLPSFLAGPGGFVEVQGTAADTHRVVGQWSVIYSVAPIEMVDLEVGSGTVAVERRYLPEPLGHVSHPLIVLLALLIPLALALRRGRFALSGPDAMALLALLALLRCGLDPVNNIYYHVPFLLALLGWDSLEGKRLPLRALAATGVAAAFWGWAVDLRDPALVNAAYTAAFLGATLAIAAALARAPLSQRRLGRRPSSRPRTQPAHPG